VRLLLVVVLFLIIGIAGWFVFVPQRPSPSGAHSVGQAEIVLQVSEGRSIPVTIWYPAAGPRGGATPLASPPLEAPTPAPLILYSPGWGQTRTQSRIQVENLASHGFVVVGCDDFASSAAGADHDVRFDLSSDAAMAATIERAGRDAVGQARRLLEVLRALAAGQSALLAGHVDFNRVGVLGYSIGGAAGLTAALMDTRIVAVLSVDGGLFGPPATEIGTHAYFLLSSREAFPSEAELAAADPFTRNYALVSALDLPRNRRRMEQPDSYWALVRDADHTDLSDSLFAFSIGKIHRTNFERRAMNAAIRAFEVAFFRKVLRDEEGPLLGLVGRDDQTVRWISPTSPPAGAANARQ
jgi:dienelactone hydrolase